MIERPSVTADARDIVHSRAIESRPRAADDALYRQLVRALPAAVYTTDARGRITLYNDAAAQLWGTQPRIGIDLWCGSYRIFRLDGSPMPPDECPMALTLKHGRAALGHELIVERPDGSRRHVLPYPQLLRSASGEITGAVNMLVDITEHRDAQQALHDTREHTASLRALTVQLIQAEQRNRKRLAQALHDGVQQLLAAVKMQAELARADADRAATLDQVIQLTEQAIDACRTLAVGLSPPVLHDGDLVAALRWLARHMKSQHGLDTRVTANATPDLPEELRVLLFEVARELLFNVATHAGVNWADLELAWRDNDLCLTVTDQGRGCDPAAIERPDRESVGLFSVRERLAGLGGSLRIERPDTGGLRVCVALPVPQASVARDAERRTERATVDRTPAPPATLRVLLADDHQILRQGLAEVLSTQPGIEVVGQASDGIEAVEAARRLRPDAVLMDISMPRMGGIDATRIICDELPGTRVVGLSMHDQADMASAMRAAGAEAYLNKADPLHQLLNALRPA